MSWISRLKNTLRPHPLDHDLADEIRDHIERRAFDLRGRGIQPEEAHRRAALVFGNATAIVESSREVKLLPALEGWLRDIRYAWRGLLRNPVFASTAIASLSLAIGANTAIYSLVDAVLLRSLPVPQPERLFTLALPTPAADNDVFSYPSFEQSREAAGDSARIALFDTPNRVEMESSTAVDAPSENAVQQFVSPDAFDILGVPPALGRLTSNAEDHLPSPRKVVVLSFDYWHRRFSADPEILGRSIVVSGRTYSVLGVAREGFFGVQPGKFVDLWLPITVTDPSIFTQPQFRAFRLLGRLSPGVTRERLAARLRTAIEVRPAAEGITAFRQAFLRPLWILMSVAAGILLIACANVASLLLARSTARSSEIALRVSLGASRARLLRQMLTESLLISTLAGIGGWWLARTFAPALVAMTSTHRDPVRLDLAVDGRVLFFCIAICAFSALAFGLAPAWQATALRPIERLRHSSRMRLGRLSVAVQVAFSFCLVTGGAGFLFSLRNLTTVDTGFDPKGVTVLTLSNRLSFAQRDRQLALMRELQMRTAALPGVQGTATAWMAIFTGGRRAERVVLPGQQPSPREETFYRVSPGYFATMRTPLLEGRDFTPRDNDDEPVPTIVNRAFAVRYFGTQRALGAEFRRGDGTRHQIVGIAANSLYGDLREGPPPIAYMPMKPPREFTLYVRSTLDAGSAAKMVAREAGAIGADLRVRDITTLETLVGNTIVREKLLAAVGGMFAFLALLLAAIGLFGLLNYSVTRRTRELGIRAALGAERSTLLRLVLADLLGILAGGLAAGLAGSIALLSFSRSLLFAVRTSDPTVIATSAAVFLAATLLAAAAPALRAAAVDPLLALRHD